MEQLTLKDAIALLEQALDTDGDFKTLTDTFEAAMLDTLDILRGLQGMGEDVPELDLRR